MPIYRDIYDGPPRSYLDERTAKRWVVIHSTQNDASAEGEASFAKRRTDGTSSHFYVDGNSVVQSLDTDLGAHHVGSSTGNRGGISYELTGLAAWSRTRWLSSIAWPLLAAAVARDCAEHGIVARALTVAQIRAGRTGIMTHNQARLAWGHTDHTDPGPDFPMGHLVDRVRAAMGDDMPLTRDDVDTLFNTDGVIQAPKVSAPDNRHWTAASCLVTAVNRLVDLGEHAAAEAVRSEAILAAVAGRDVPAAVRAELDRHRGLLLAALEGMEDRLAAALPGLPAEQVRAAVAAELAELRLVAEPGTES